MSNLTSRATVDLQINGQQAEQRLQQLRQNALQLETALARAAAAGDRIELKRLRKELTDTKRSIREMESSTMQVENVMRKLDRATPRELQKTLQTLNRQLEYIERGSTAWNAHVEKIKQVKAEIASINMQMREQESFATRLNRTFNEWGTAIMGAAAAMTGLVMAGRSAVSAYAEMDEELTNTQKYTGMTRESVDRMNESFKHLDTRTSRAQLNELAQEAGRLGKTSVEDVQGYVEAADIINVALVDLGAGATQTIAKLSNIFGVEKLLGTKEAMLAVGSTVNVLSQNCTASKPYLVEFAQRMAGIGAQAKMTIPEILAFGAVLDANGQKSEMASSALGKLTMMLFQDPAKMAAQVGLAVDSFTETMKRSTSEGLVMFLEKIQQLGSKEGLAVLAPLFKDLGMDGVRMSQVLSTLAAHLDEVKWQFGEANKAFREASSATHEYDLFNNTVQAGIDKAKKRMSELAIELGEKLLPVMKHVYSSTSILLRVLSTIVDFVVEYKGEIVTLTAAIVAYNVVLKATAIWQKAVNAYVLTGQVLTKGYTAVVKTLTAVKLALQVAVGKLTNNWVKQASAMADAKAAGVSLSSGYAALAAAIVVIASALYSVIKRQMEHRRQLQQQKEAARQYAQQASDLSKQTADNSAKEIAALKTLYEQAIREANSKDMRRQAAEKLQALYPAYFKNMSTEEIMVGKAKKQYDSLCQSILAVAKARAAAEKIQENMKEILALEGELDNGKVWLRNAQGRVDRLQKDYDAARAETDKANSAIPSFADSKDAGVSMRGNSDAIIGNKGQVLQNNKSNRDAAQRYVEERKKKIATLTAANEKLANTYGNQEGFDLTEPEVKFTPSAVTGSSGAGSSTAGGSTSGGGSASGSGSEDKFATEKAWKAREEALNRIAYAKGETDYETYTNRMNEIAVEFYSKELEHTDLSSDERLGIEAEYYEAQKKSKESSVKVAEQLDEKQLKEMKEAEEYSYNEMLALEKQHYIDGKTDQKTYEEASRLLEMEHLRTMTIITKEGSADRQAAVAAYQNALIEDQKKHQEEAEKLAKEHQEKLAKIKKDVFGMNPAERESAYKSDLALLQEVFDNELRACSDNAKEKLRIEEAFQKAKLALQEQYNIEGADQNHNFLENWTEDVTDFLKSDTGQAITGSLETIVSGMSSVFSGLTSIIEAETEIQTSAIEARYDKELSLCEGNTYMEKQLEKQKEAEIAKVKNEANKKLFAMQVIQAVAQTATSAINAYSSAAAIPMVGWIMAPIAAATAVAAGMIQIAAIKKQQQASEAQGYASGGYTPRGSKHEEVGVVHAGEWVASQELLANPVASSMIEALDYAQRTNTIGSLSASDVSSTITAPTVLAQNSNSLKTTPQQVIVQNQPAASTGDGVGLSEYADTMRALKDRLDLPFVTVNSVTGDAGIEQAQNEYDRLIRNKTPKSRR